MNHTKEPWSLKEVANYSGRIKYLVPVDSENMSLLTIVENERAVFPAICEDEDARRIVACVNACAGISTENLEDNLPLKELAHRYNKTLKQRDKLLTALKRLSFASQTTGGAAGRDDGLCAAIDDAEAVIASVKGGAA
jgi:hypothetical protein